jgi:hypothetical protein
LALFFLAAFLAFFFAGIDIPPFQFRIRGGLVKIKYNFTSQRQ